MSVKDTLGTILILGVVVLLIGGGMMTLSGISSQRAESNYSGYVVDTEYERGLIFQTTQLNVKTHPRSSEHETFCVKVPEDEQFVEDARQALNNGSRVEITYSRPMYVAISECEGQTSIVQDITVMNETAQ